MTTKRIAITIFEDGEKKTVGYGEVTPDGTILSGEITDPEYAKKIFVDKEYDHFSIREEPKEPVRSNIFEERDKT